ncbi:MAG TPA: VOC family protein [Nitrososphaerales archaeon]|nr:VOC family protein [Nitrososphaerales archaeon]
MPEEEWISANAIIDPEEKGMRIHFQKMDTTKLGKIDSIDINASGGLRVPLAEAKGQGGKEVELLVGIRAKKDHELEDKWEYCVIMLDPEGNEFCVQ